MMFIKKNKIYCLKKTKGKKNQGKYCKKKKIKFTIKKKSL